jgi:tRNA(adenine34) deaminase
VPRDARPVGVDVAKAGRARRLRRIRRRDFLRCGWRRRCPGCHGPGCTPPGRFTLAAARPMCVRFGRPGRPLDDNGVMRDREEAADGRYGAMTGGAADGRDERMMALALEEARRCPSWGDVPVGAVLAEGERILGSAGNRRERTGDPTAHAEVIALREAARARGTWRLDGCTLYVTLEPCAMCAGALVLARVDRLVFAAPDPKAGFAGSLGDLVRHPRLNHRLEVTAGVLAEESSALLRAFFAERRRTGPADRAGGEPEPVL